MTTQYNVVTYGSLTNTSGVLSGFSASNYATIPLNFNPVQRPYEVVFKFAGTNGIIWNVGDVTTARGHIEFEVYQSKLYAEFAANETLLWSIEGVTTISPNTDYWVKLAYNGVDTYSLYLSTDGTTWNTEGTATSNDFLGDGSTEYNLIGVQISGGVIDYAFNGSIDLNGSYINIDNIRWWQGATTVSNVRTKVQLRHDTAANWTSVNPILLDGEVGIETDTRKQKFGDGVTAWNSLPYDYGSTALQSITSSNVTTALGYTPVNPSSLATVATSGAYSDLSGTPTVDQTYDSTSTDAQSGVAIEGELSTNYVKSTAEDISQGITSSIGYLSGLFPNMQTTYGNYQLLCGCVDGVTLLASDTNTNNNAGINVIPTGVMIVQGSKAATLSVTNSNNLAVNGNEIATQSWVTNQGYLTAITSTDITNALGYTPLNKAGDTMSGSLNFSSIGGGRISLNNISEGGYSDIQYSMTNGLRAGFVRANNVSSTERNIQITACNDSGSPTSSFFVGHKNGSDYCTFPNTACCDGQWINTHILLTNSTAIGNYRLDLSSYLPNDGQKYEVILSGLAYNSSSTYANIFLDNAHGSDGQHFVARVGTNSRMACVDCMLPVDSARDIYLTIDNGTITWESNYGWSGLYLVGYRRIGTNV